MTLPRTAAVLGLGLMGGSLARDLAALGVEVLGHDRDPEAERAAIGAGVVRRALPASLEGAEAADLVVLATPGGAAAGLLERLAPRLAPGALATDLGSTKRPVVEAAARLGIGGRFVGSHPLAGDHRSGWEASRTGLFAGARVFLAPTPSTEPEALARARALWERLGALPEAVEAEAHDRRLAWSSHLPQAASSALARALAGAGVPRGELGPGGRDVTRLAAGSPEMWSSICLDNAAPLGEAVAALAAELARLEAALRARDAAALEGFFAGARGWSAGGGTDSADGAAEQSPESRIP